MKHHNARFSRAGFLFLAVAGLFAYARADWGPETRLTNLLQGLKSTLSGGSRAICSSGDVVNVVWNDQRFGADDLYHIRSTDGGVTWQTEQRLTMNVDKASLRAGIASSGTMVVVVWEDDRDDNPEIYCKVSQDAGGSWSNDLRLTANEVRSANPCVAVTGSTIHVVWEDDGDGGRPLVFYKRSDDGGSSWTSAIHLDPGEALLPSVAARDTMVHVVWTIFDMDRFVFATLYTRSTDRGNTWSPARLLTDVSVNQLFPSISVWGNQVHAAWVDERHQSEQQVYYKRSDDDGANWHGDRRVSVGGGIELGRTFSGLAGLGQNVHVTWTDSRNGNTDIYYQRSTNGGAAWLAADYLLTPNPDEQLWASVAASGTKVHVAYTDTRHGDFEIYYRRDPTGSAVAEPARPVFGVTALELRPNPFARVAAAPGRENDWFEVYDLSGKKAGSYRGTGIGGDLLPGVYFVRDRAGASGGRIVKTR